MEQQIAFEQIVHRGCGMDGHRDTDVATVLGEELKKKPALTVPTPMRFTY